MKKERVSPAELEVLRYVIETSPVTARDVAEAMAEAKGIARTTSHTLLDRLRKKGHIVRTSQHGVHLYSPAEDGSEVLKGLVADFVRNTLGGSLSPFVAFFSEKSNLSEQETEALRKLLERSEEKS
jgi:predicted transcriptional regulator